MKFLAIILFSLFSHANSLCDQDIDKIPVLSQGRIKPFSVFALETMKFLTPEKKPLGMSRVKATCLLALNVFNQGQHLDVPLRVEYIDAKELLKMDTSKTSLVFSELEGQEMEIRSAWAGIKENNSYKKELNKISSRMNLFQSLKNGSLFSVIDTNGKWFELKDLDFETFKGHFIENEQIGNAHILEHYLFMYHPFSIAILFIIFAIFALSILKKPNLGIFLSIIALAIQVLTIGLRVYISGRAPITNMYETVMFSGFGAALIALILTIVKKDKIFLLAGISYNILCLFMMNFANNMLEPSISPLVPVLRDNFWLSTHVTTIILSYAALAISWILANIFILKRRLGIKVESPLRQTKIIYQCVQIGVVMLAAGIILGGIWADYSWGRFWGWDPKETWSLIALLIYMAILHGKYSSWINNKNFIPMIAAAFMSIIMAWFGVNYILASGLHSYGFSEGGAIFIGSLFLVQTIIIVLYYLPHKSPQNLK